MRKTLIFTALALASSLALAQATPADREAARAERRAQAEARFAQADKNADGRLDRAEAEAMNPRLASHFDRVDANGDGLLAKEEMAQARQRMMQARQAGQGKRGYAAGLFAGMDDDKDGALTRVEIGDKAPRLVEHFSAIDTDGDGRITRDEMKAHHQAMRAARGGKAG